MATRSYWRLHSETDTFIVNAITADWPNIVIGEPTTLRVWLRDDGDLTVSSGETYTVHSETAAFFETVTDDGGTLTVAADGELVQGSEEDRWADVNAYLDYAGQVVVGESIDHVPWFVELLPTDARISSLVLGFEPSPRLQERGVEGVWGLLQGGRDVRNSPLTDHQLELDVTALERFDQYADVAAVKADLEA